MRLGVWVRAAIVLTVVWMMYWTAHSWPDVQACRAEAEPWSCSFVLTAFPPSWTDIINRLGLAVGLSRFGVHGNLLAGLIAAPALAWMAGLGTVFALRWVLSGRKAST